MMILGNKCDLADSRVVSKERGQLMADKHGIKFMETSAKANINMETVSFKSILVIYFIQVANLYNRCIYL